MLEIVTWLENMCLSTRICMCTKAALHVYACVCKTTFFCVSMSFIHVGTYVGAYIYIYIHRKMCVYIYIHTNFSNPSMYRFLICLSIYVSIQSPTYQTVYQSIYLYHVPCLAACLRAYRPYPKDEMNPKIWAIYIYISLLYPQYGIWTISPFQAHLVLKVFVPPNGTKARPAATFGRWPSTSASLEPWMRAPLGHGRPRVTENYPYEPWSKLDRISA